MAPRPAEWTKSRKFGVVIDAGSSGSRIQVYSWINPDVDRQQRKANGKSLDVLSRVEKGVEHGDDWHSRVEPGISTLAGDPDAVGPYLKPLLDFATQVIPKEQLSDTPIYLLATAGMRLLPEDERDALLAEACSYMRTYPFSLPDCTEAVRVITGEEEGLYGWIAVNYLMDGFDKHEHAKTSKELSHDSSTYGFLDMGGASTQIAFEPSEVERIKHADNLLDVKMQLLSGKRVKHPVFVTTWLGFGTNQARDRYIEQEVRAHASSSTNTDESEEGDTLIDDPCLPNSLMLADTRHPGYTLRGTGDFAQCVRRTGPLLNKEVECLDDPCLFNGVHVPPIDFSVNHFIGISEYWYSTQDVWSMGAVYDYVEFERNAIDFCSRSWDDILADHQAGTRWKPSVEISRLEMQCFKAAWIVNILHEGIGIPRIIDPSGEGDGRNQTAKATAKGVQKGLISKKPPSFQSVNEVGDVAVSWTLGKMVLEVSKGELSEEVPQVSSSRFSNWRSHFPTWKGDVRETFHEVKDKPVPVAGIIVLAVVLWVYCVSPSAARRRKHLFAHARKKSDYNLVRAEEDAANSDSSGSGANGGRRRSTSPGVMARIVSPVRKMLYRLSSSLRKSSKPSTGLLPTTARMSSTTSSSGENNFRPSALRHVQSQPFLRSTPTASTTMSQIQHGNSATFYLDAPDVSDRVLARSQSATTLPPAPPSTTAHATASTTGTSTPPHPSISGGSISRPSTPGGGTIINRSTSAGNLNLASSGGAGAGGSGSISGPTRSINRLAMSKTVPSVLPPSSSAHSNTPQTFGVPLSTSSSTTSISGSTANANESSSNLADGVWASLGEQHYNPHHHNSNGAGGGSAASTPTGGAKLRTTISASGISGGGGGGVGGSSNLPSALRERERETRSASSSMTNVRDSYFQQRPKDD